MTKRRVGVLARAKLSAARGMYPELLPPLRGPPVSLRLGHAQALTPHRGVIHYLRTASLPQEGGLLRVDANLVFTALARSASAT